MHSIVRCDLCMVKVEKEEKARVPNSSGEAKSKRLTSGISSETTKGSIHSIQSSSFNWKQSSVHWPHLSDQNRIP